MYAYWRGWTVHVVNRLYMCVFCVLPRWAAKEKSGDYERWLVPATVCFVLLGLSNLIIREPNAKLSL
jgi:hypothetical protein